MKKILIVLIGIIILTIPIGFATTPAEILDDAGIIQGDGTGYAEDKPLTREEMITILARINSNSNYENFDYSGESGFIDVPNDHWAAPYISFAKIEGITNGIGDNKFGLGEYINGKQAIIFIARNLGVKNTGDYYEKGYDLAYYLEEETGINLKSMPLNKYDENISRNRVFSLLIEGLRQEHIEKKSKLSDLLNINIPPEEDIDYPSSYTLTINESKDDYIKEKDSRVTYGYSLDDYYEVNPWLKKFELKMDPAMSLSKAEDYFGKSKLESDYGHSTSYSFENLERDRVLSFIDFVFIDNKRYELKEPVLRDYALIRGHFEGEPNIQILKNIKLMDSYDKLISMINVDKDLKGDFEISLAPSEISYLKRFYGNTVVLRIEDNYIINFSIKDGKIVKINYNLENPINYVDNDLIEDLE